jgi:DNA-binding CsgD family transcriptional regulator
MPALFLTEEVVPISVGWVKKRIELLLKPACTGGGTMNARHLRSHQELAVHIALHRFSARYRCPCPDLHEWRADCEAVAVVAVLTVDDESLTEPSMSEMFSEGADCTPFAVASLQQVWEALCEAERQRVLWLARQAENALKRFWRQEHRFYSRTEALVVTGEVGEWVELEIEDTDALDALETVLEQVDRGRFLAALCAQLNDRERLVLAARLEGKTQIEIAQELRISQQAVSKCWGHICQKAAVLRAEWGW